MFWRWQKYMTCQFLLHHLIHNDTFIWLNSWLWLLDFENRETMTRLDFFVYFKWTIKIISSHPIYRFLELQISEGAKNSQQHAICQKFLFSASKKEQIINVSTNPHKTPICKNKKFGIEIVIPIMFLDYYLSHKMGWL